MQADAISPKQTVVIIDDVIATGAYYHIKIQQIQRTTGF